LRAPWADARAITEEIETYPRKWRAEPLGKLLRFTGLEWMLLRLRTIAPIDMTKEQRRAYCQAKHNERLTVKRRRSGVKPRVKYLAVNSRSRDKPWEAQGMSRATWYRLPESVRQVCSNKDMNVATHLSQTGVAPRVRGKRSAERRLSQTAVAKAHKSSSSLQLAGMPPSTDLSCLAGLNPDFLAWVDLQLGCLPEELAQAA
jgi:hypothetical protein